MSNLARLLKESWTLVEEDQDKLASYFYARIFLANPQLRDLFPVQMDVQRARLLGAIVTAVQSVDDPERFDEYLRSLGRDHRKFHVSPEHYDAVGAALMEALRTFAGQEWSVEYDQAWRDAYAVIARKMIAGADNDSDNPPYRHAEVLHHERRNNDIAVLTTRPLHPLEFRAGQYLSVECKYQPRLWRVYSAANAPRKDGTIDFHVRAVGAGWVSSALVRRVKPGDMLRLAAPMGQMTLDRKSTRDIVCIAGGTGLAPIKALIEELTRYNRTRQVPAAKPDNRNQERRHRRCRYSPISASAQRSWTPSWRGSRIPSRRVCGRRWTGCPRRSVAWSATTSGGATRRDGR